MSDETNKLIIESTPTQQRFNELMGRLFDVARPQSVYSEPVTAGNFTVITASELTAGLGAGFGGGIGLDNKDTGAASQSGGGGGGSALARPVAIIVIGPEGVRVEPVVDPTKIAVAFFTTLGAMVFSWRKMQLSK